MPLLYNRSYAFSLVIVLACIGLAACKSRNITKEQTKYLGHAIPTRWDTIDLSKHAAFTCSDGLFFITSGDSIRGGMCYTDKETSCHFLFTGKKTGVERYEIRCTDTEADWHQTDGQWSVTRSIPGRMQVSPGIEEVTIALEKDPAGCENSLSLRFRDTALFSILAVEGRSIKEPGIIKTKTALKKGDTTIQLWPMQPVIVLAEKETTYTISCFNTKERKYGTGEIEKKHLQIFRPSDAK